MTLMNAVKIKPTNIFFQNRSVDVHWVCPKCGYEYISHYGYFDYKNVTKICLLCYKEKDDN